MPKTCSEDAALADGFTRRPFADCDQHSIEIMVQPDVDLDSRFLAYDLDNHEWIRISGWLWTFEAVEA